MEECQDPHMETSTQFLLSELRRTEVIQLFLNIFDLLFKWTGSNIGFMQKFTSINAVLVTPVFQFDGLDKQTYVIKFIIGLLKNN